MRPHLLLVILLALPVMAQTTDPLLDDATGDVAVRLSDQQAPMVAGFENFDLQALTITESLDAFDFIVQVADLDPDAELTYVESMDIELGFRFGHVEYRLIGGRWTEAGNAGTWGGLYEHDADSSQNRWKAPAVFSADTAADTITARVERAFITDEDGAVPRPGTTLGGFFVRIDHIDINPRDIASLIPGSPQIMDRMPDTGSDGTYAVQLGLAQAGTIQLASLRPYRVSNGEATTMIFTATATNTKDTAQWASLQVANLPDGWTHRLPQQVIDVPAQATATVQILVTMPFAHQHGSRESFHLIAVDEDGKEAHIEMGVQFTNVPQPSGHHSTLWMHARAMSSAIASQATKPAPGSDHWLTMNTLEDDPFDDGEPVQAQWSSSSNIETRRWTAYLSPGLQMGLEFEPRGTASITATIEARTAMTQTNFIVNAYHWATDDRTEYETTKLYEAYTATGDWLPGEVREVTLEFPVEAIARLEQRLYQGMTFQFFLSGPQIGPNAAMDPYLLPGLRLDLPLREYHDDLGAIEAGSIGLSASLPELLANPGEGRAFNLTIANHANEAKDITMTWTGPAMDVVFQPHAFRLGPGETRHVLAIAGAPDLAHGDVLELVIAASDGQDTAFQRLRLTIDTQTDHPDDHALLRPAGEHEAPVPGVIPIIALLVLARRRRRSHQPDESRPPRQA